MTTENDIPILCTVCNHEKEWHRGVVHPFTPPGVEWDMRVTSSGQSPDPIRVDGEPDGNVAVRLMRGPIDPVLRMALVDKGIITPEELQAAEAKMGTVTQVMFGGDQVG